MTTFWILFLRWKPGKLGLIITFLVGWGFIIGIVVSGPTGIQRADAGPFCESYFYVALRPTLTKTAAGIDAISGYWCWISDQYPSQRIT